MKLDIAHLAASAAAMSMPGAWTGQQQPLGSSSSSGLKSLAQTSFACDLPPVVDPSGDGLPSADDVFGSRAATAKQVERHQAIVRVPTVSYDDLRDPGDDERWAPFFDLHALFEDLFPLIHKKANVTKINTLGLLYTLQGSDPSLKPTLLAAHQDVVPVADASTWTHPPFAAVYDGEWIWGRGASDDKSSLTAELSAVEALLEAGWTPRRTLLLAFGFDEECSGFRGAGRIGAHLRELYGPDSLAVILDEGGTGLGPAVAAGAETDPDSDEGALYAVPAVAEKGHVDVYFDLSVAGGHSSFPTPHTGIGIIAEVVAALEAHPWTPAVLDDSPVHRRLQCQARYSPAVDPQLTQLVRGGDLQGLAGLLASSDRVSHYTVQTSQAVDTIRGGQKINALPESIHLGVNYRVAPQDSISAVFNRIVDVIGPVVDKYKLHLKPFEGDDDYKPDAVQAVSYVAEGGDVDAAYSVDYNGTLVLSSSERSPATPVSPTDNAVWNTFSGVAQHSFATKSGAPVVPVGIIMTGNTDTRHYLGLSPNVYRWTPARQGTALNIHTVDERIRVDGHVAMVKFYYNFVRAFDQADL